MSFFSQTVEDPFLNHTLQIRFVPGRYAVSQLRANTDVPGWFSGPGFKAAIYSEDETTLVCFEDRVPAEVETERGWACLRTVGPFPFDAAGVVQSLIEPLSTNGIGVFVVCTYDGEHVLIPASDTTKAVHCLEAAGHVCCG
ncbi:ACT domain-containing protein [Leisingera caerulea]|uniref:ACT domain-containing protein n=1 Tax=Leisingera caerulea TaxID=506591 RepID=UPI0021A2A66F|nr:ACT domain-containing protein [Leisingera caerulea]UWQ63553.1 ACT domain-containing protein [Leisingera caerulea]